MQLTYEVKLVDDWVAAEAGIILADGRLGFTAGEDRGVIRPPYWRHSEETTRQPEFRRACFESLTAEERDSAIARIGRPQF